MNTKKQKLFQHGRQLKKTGHLLLMDKQTKFILKEDNTVSKDLQFTLLITKISGRKKKDPLRGLNIWKLYQTEII